jgi:hypothetical protein
VGRHVVAVQAHIEMLRRLRTRRTDEKLGNVVGTSESEECVSQSARLDGKCVSQVGSLEGRCVLQVASLEGLN